MPFSLDTYLQSFLNWENQLDKATLSGFGLERVERLLEAVGHPEDRLKFVHIAGSKGKGSTAAFLASILRASGYRVGLFTSPHFYSYSERIRVLEPGGDPSPFEGMISDEDLADRIRFYQTDIDRIRDEGVVVTFFELWTAIALTYFAQRKVDIVVLETGLGGRLDATNAMDSLVCGITSIGLEHTAILGDTLEKIASEKAGIIKSVSQRVVLASQADEAMRVLKERCRLIGITPSVVGEGISYHIDRQDDKGLCFYVEGRRAYRDLTTSLTGHHQAVNASVALGMAEDLEIYGFLISEESVRQGIVQAVWPARFEILGKAPAVILDCAHTGESASALAETFAQIYPGQKAVIVMGLSGDKDCKAICAALDPITKSVVMTKADHPRAVEPSHLKAGVLFPSKDVAIVADVSEALKLAQKDAGPQGIVLVCGSIFVCAEARKCLLM